jgi:2-haloacid dehalogenase
VAVTPIEAVVFDVGGVLLEWDPRHLYRELFHDEVAMNRFLSEVCTMEWHAQHDRGIPYESSCEELAAAYPEHSELIWAWAHRGEEMVAGVIDGTMEIVDQLKSHGVRCYLLTNMEAVTWPQRLERYPFLGSFDGAVVSGLEGVVKPEPEIFKRLLARFDLSPSETLFIDDTRANVETARSLGMKAVQFKSPEQLRKWLGDVGLLGPR